MTKIVKFISAIDWIFCATTRAECKITANISRDFILGGVVGDLTCKFQRSLCLGQREREVRHKFSTHGGYLGPPFQRTIISAICQSSACGYAVRIAPNKPYKAPTDTSAQDFWLCRSVPENLCTN